MLRTVEAQQRAVSRVLDLEHSGATRAEASRAVAGQTGVRAALLRRWVDAHQRSRALAPEGPGPGPGAGAPPAGARRSLRRPLAPPVLLRGAAAGASAIAVGADITVKFPLTSTSVLAVALLPVWLPHLRRYRRATLVVVLGIASVVSGWALGAFSTEHAVDPAIAEATAVSILSGAGAIGLLLWVRTTLGTQAMAVLVGVGMLVAVGLDGLNPVNPWKFGLSLPITTIVLAVAARRGQPVLSAAALILLAVVGLANDSRSYAGFAVLTAAVALWQAIPSAAAGRRRSAWQRVQLGALLAIGLTGASAVGQSLLVDGALGAKVAARSQAQVAAGGGSLLAGGRPELQATVELAQARPWGFGLGAVPNQEDVLLAKQGMARVGIQPGNGYVDNYMFGGHIELHSVIADLWAGCGVVGAAFGFAMAFVLLDALLAGAAARRASALLVFWVASAVWFLGFGPLYSNLPDVAFAVALALAPVAQRAALSGAAGPPRPGTSATRPRA